MLREKVVRTITVPCNKCGYQNNKNIWVFPPENYTNPKKAETLSQYWCPVCEEAQAVRFSIFRDLNGEVAVRIGKKIEPTSLFIPRKPKKGITIRPRSKGKNNKEL